MEVFWGEMSENPYFVTTQGHRQQTEY